MKNQLKQQLKANLEMPSQLLNDAIVAKLNMKRATRKPSTGNSWLVGCFMVSGVLAILVLSGTVNIMDEQVRLTLLTAAFLPLGLLSWEFLLRRTHPKAKP
ncbi:hypothetical protein HUK80_11250 [Flavobacterium sp. MAH-1]|uniref:Uncharacterized protein n=1 Tax=Flavobacterium agri TaxID=2743471 RepID=A0A7Y8Y2Q2_9FLAO|nr:hypothetical protein [Flavobacterium agri]NUY81475.1 hypothetical protein [Flavobacterium agri]NYA71499.1 hypothetical protein [Flavobacterium agri]